MMQRNYATTPLRIASLIIIDICTAAICSVTSGLSRSRAFSLNEDKIFQERLDLGYLTKNTKEDNGT
jgi:anaerobic C4-dicarboxylate transporter